MGAKIEYGTLRSCTHNPTKGILRINNITFPIYIEATTQYNSGDVIMMFIFGIVGYILRKFHFDLGPLLLAFILGRMLESSLSQALLISGGDFSIFFTRPISAAILSCAALMILIPLITKLVRKIRNNDVEVTA